MRGAELLRALAGRLPTEPFATGVPAAWEAETRTATIAARHAAYSSGTQPANERRAMQPEHILVLAVVAIVMVAVLLALDRNDQEN